MADFQYRARSIRLPRRFSFVPMLSALRILFDVVVFRLRRLEMANLAGAVSV